MGLVIIILIIMLFWIFGPQLMRGLQVYASRKMEDRLRRMMGMPSRAEEKKARRGEERNGKAGGWREKFRRQSSRGRGGDPAADVRMMKEYAEDVEYVEIHEYSESIKFSQDAGSENIKIRQESQVSDAEYVIITKK